MFRQRSNCSRIWNFFTKVGHPNDFKARCAMCKGCYSYKTTTGNLKIHLKKKHHSTFAALKEQDNDDSIWVDNADEDSNSSLKFSSEVWKYFEVEDDSTICTICKKTTQNSVEEMRTHLGEEHPGVMIGILKKSGDDDATDEEKLQEDNLAEETFTEVVYLEEEPRPKRYKQPTRNRTSVTLNSSKEEKQIETPRIEYKVIPHAPETKHTPEIESFLNYVGCLLKNVPKEKFPMLQLEIISLIVKAQIAPKPTSSNSVTTPSVGSNIEVPSSIATVNSTGDYRLTIAGIEEGGSQ